MQCGRSRKNTARVEVEFASVEIAERTAGFAHDDSERCDIEDVYVGFDDEIDTAACEQMVVKKIAVAADAARVADELAEHIPSRVAGERFNVADGDRGGIELRGISDADRFAVEK